jgi:hypothetical protein
MGGTRGRLRLPTAGSEASSAAVVAHIGMIKYKPAHDVIHSVVAALGRRRTTHVYDEGSTHQAHVYF